MNSFLDEQHNLPVIAKDKVLTKNVLLIVPANFVVIPVDWSKLKENYQTCYNISLVDFEDIAGVNTTTIPLSDIFDRVNQFDFSGYDIVCVPDCRGGVTLIKNIEEVLKLKNLSTIVCKLPEVQNERLTYFEIFSALEKIKTPEKNETPEIVKNKKLKVTLLIPKNLNFQEYAYEFQKFSQVTDYEVSCFYGNSVSSLVMNDAKDTKWINCDLFCIIPFETLYTEYGEHSFGTFVAKLGNQYKLPIHVFSADKSKYTSVESITQLFKQAIESPAIDSTKLCEELPRVLLVSDSQRLTKNFKEKIICETAQTGDKYYTYGIDILVIDTELDNFEDIIQHVRVYDPHITIVKIVDENAAKGEILRSTVFSNNFKESFSLIVKYLKSLRSQNVLILSDQILLPNENLDIFNPSKNFKVSVMSPRKFMLEKSVYAKRFLIEHQIDIILIDQAQTSAYHTGSSNSSSYQSFSFEEVYKAVKFASLDTDIVVWYLNKSSRIPIVSLDKFFDDLEFHQSFTKADLNLKVGKLNIS